MISGNAARRRDLQRLALRQPRPGELHRNQRRLHSRNLGNVLAGVVIQDTSAANTVGGDVAGAGNLISGNDAFGVLTVRAVGVEVTGNLIGTLM